MIAHDIVPTTWAGELVPKNKLPANLVKMYESYSFDAYDNRGAFAYDSIAEWKETTACMMDRAWQATSELEPGLRDQEREFIKAMAVCWRLRGMGLLLAKHDLVVKNEEQAQLLRPHLRLTGLRYAEAIENTAASQLAQWWNDSTVKVAKGKGAPYWIPGSDPFGAVALGVLAHSAQSVEELTRMVLEAGDAEMPLVQTAYVRIQSSGKPQPHRVLVGGTIQEVGTRRGPKTRKIAAQPFVFNVLWAGYGGIMKELLKTVTNRNTGRIEVTQANVKHYKYSIAVDLKGFDDTVSIETLDTYRELVIKPTLDALVRKGLVRGWQRAMLLELDHNTQRMPILLPPWQTGWGASLVRTEGGISSGERLTAQKGSDINRCRIDAKFEMLGLRGTSTNQGDDTIINSDDSAISRWLEVPEWAGFTEEAAADISFLMKHMPEGYAYLGRMLMSTINKEASRESPNIIAAASAIGIRRELLNGHPASREYMKILSECGNKRIQYALALAREHSPTELLNKAFALPTKTDQAESLIEDMEKWLEREPEDSERGVFIEHLIAKTEERFQMRNEDFIKEVKKVTFREAYRYIRSKSYARRNK